MIKSKQVLRFERKDGVTTAYLSGEIDHHTAGAIRRELDEYLTEHRPSVLRLDLSDIHFMDSSGLGLLMGRYALMSRLGGALVVCDPSPSVWRMIRLAGMERVLRIEQSKKTQEKGREG